MRDAHDDFIDNALTKMFNAQRDYINQEINRLASPEQRSTDFRRNGTGNFGARQMQNFFGDSNFAIVGTTMGSTTVS